MPSGDPFAPETDPASRRVATGLSKIGLALKHRSWREASERRLSPTQGQALAALARRDGRGRRLSELAEELGITAPTASDAVASLESKGLVRKLRSKRDAREVAIRLTAKGRREAVRAAAWPEFLADAVEELTAEEQAVLLRSLVKMIRALQERGEISVARMCATCRFFRPNAHAGGARPHHCDFVDAPFGDRSLRLDCPDHEPAAPEEADTSWQLFLGKEMRT